MARAPGVKRRSKSTAPVAEKAKKVQERDYAWAEAEVHTSNTLMDKAYAYLEEELDRAVAEEGNVMEIQRILKALQDRKKAALAAIQALGANKAEGTAQEVRERYNLAGDLGAGD